MDTQHQIMQQIATVHTGFSSKFGIPRQSGLAEAVRGTVTLEPAFRNPDFVRGLTQFSHIWLLWGFSQVHDGVTPTVRPPRLGGNERIGVFASRSPFRPNPIAMSCVRLLEVDTQHGTTVLHISGADILDGSPVYDIKPYVPTDCVPDAKTGYASASAAKLSVLDPQGLLELLPAAQAEAVRQLLSLDPRPAYHDDPARRYVMEYGGAEVVFTVRGQNATVCEVRR